MIVVTEKEVEKKKRPSFGNSEEVKAAQLAQAQAKGINIERKVSHGIGGYGNYRRPSDPPFPPKTSSGQHNSIWSKLSTSPSTSPTERRGSFFNAFRKNSIIESEALLTGDEPDDSRDDNVQGRQNSDR